MKKLTDEQRERAGKCNALVGVIVAAGINFQVGERIGRFEVDDHKLFWFDEYKGDHVRVESGEPSSWIGRERINHGSGFLNFIVNMRDYIMDREPIRAHQMRNWGGTPEGIEFIKLAARRMKMMEAA